MNIENSDLVQNWIAGLDPKFKLKAFEIQSFDTVVRNGKEEILFVKIKAEIYDQQSRRLPGIVFLRGASVGILIILKVKKEEYVVLIKSSLPAIGQVDYMQLPAGMMDRETDSLNVALRELREETGIDTSGGSMINLTQMFYGDRLKGIYPSPGACDEVIKLFAYIKEVDDEEVHRIHGKQTGLASEYEHLTLEVVRISDLCRLTADVKAHSAYIMYTQLKTEGKL